MNTTNKQPKQRKFPRTKAFASGLATGASGLVLMGAAAGSTADGFRDTRTIRSYKKSLRNFPEPSGIRSSSLRYIKTAKSLRRGSIAAGIVLGTVGAGALYDAGSSMRRAFKKRNKGNK